MKSKGYAYIIWVLLSVGAIAGLGWVVSWKIQDHTGRKSGNSVSTPVPVEVAEIQKGSIRRQRTFTGELEAEAELIIAPKVSGRVERIFVGIADSVERGQVMAELDHDEYVQALAQARADLAVARANLSEAESALKIADREFRRSESLRNRGITAASDFDAASQNRLAKQARVQVAAAQLARAESSLEIAKIRLGYTEVKAVWADGNGLRVVAERYVDEGQTVEANAPLFLIVQLDPIRGVVYVTEKDYTRLKPGQKVTLTVDAYAGEAYTGRISRIAPVFDTSTRQARVEMIVDNPQHKLKPGMFIKSTVVLDHVADAVIVPAQALTRRNDRQGVFIVNEDSRSVAWHDVTVGISDGDRVQVEGRGLSGRVVTLGQQMIEDGSAISIPAEQSNGPIDNKKAKGQ